MGLSLGDINKKTGDPTMVARATVSLGSLKKASTKTGADLTQGLFECGVEIDSSYSLEHAYRDGSVQDAAERTLAWTSMVDSSGGVDAGFFDSKAHSVSSLTLDNYRGWVKTNLPGFGGTNLYDAIVTGAKMAAKALGNTKILDLFATKTFGNGYKLQLNQLQPIQADRIFHLTIITDGAPNHGPRAMTSNRRQNPYAEAIKELIVRLSYAGIFIKFIFVGDDAEGREFLQLLDDMPVAKHQNDLADEGPNDPRASDVDWFAGARYIDNVDKVEFPHGLSRVSDEEFAEAMTQELPTYVPCAVRRGLVSMKNVVGI